MSEVKGVPNPKGCGGLLCHNFGPEDWWIGDPDKVKPLRIRPGESVCLHPDLTYHRGDEAAS